ncbi:hypothetical protein AgCh_016030 [Apium graveolens]
MHPDKASGPDGLNPAFYQHFWKLLGPEVYLSCKSWMSDLAFPAELNDTIIVLIPKKENADAMKDLRHIALCNILYKVIAKVLANRLKDILPDIITENQSAFVPGRNISDNVLVAFELLHFMKRKNYSSNGEVALKLDVSKAYDRIGPVNPNRGLRQGDPLSPYLFLFCVEGLSFLLTKAVENGKIHGCQINAQAPSVTHLLFADDSFLFFKASSEEANEVVSVLQKYEKQSGQAINFLKSGIFFSSNVRMDKQQEIKELLEVHSDLSAGHYLGLPSLIGRSKKKVFDFIKDKMWKRIQGWSMKCLSRAGKAVLLRNVAQSIPNYVMSCFMLPKSLCQEIERMMNSFWWGSKAKEALKQGFRWVLGDGEDIRVFEDAWLKGKTDFRVDSGNNNRGGISKVKELFIPGEKRSMIALLKRAQLMVSSLLNLDITFGTLHTVHVVDQINQMVGSSCGDVEHPMHIFFDCVFANNCWKYFGLEFDVTRTEVASDWLLDKLFSESTEVCGCIAAILWGIWFARNQKVWERKILTPELAMQWSMKQVTQWREVNQSKKLMLSGMSRSPLSFVVRWKAPVEGRVKLNVDASIYPGTSSFSLGMVLRNHVGIFIQAKTMVKAGVVTVLEAEVWGIDEAIEWV